MSRPIITPDVPVIVAASILSIYDAPMLPIVKVGSSATTLKAGVELFQAIGSQPIITLLANTDPSDYYRALWNPCTTTSIWIGSLGYGDTFDRLLSIFELTGFGDAKVDTPSSPPALLTLDEVVGLYAEKTLKCNLEAKQVASPAISVASDTMLLDAMRTMCERRVRRLFLEEKEGEFISDRGILAFLFSPKGLKVARDSPGVWNEMRVSDIQARKAHKVSPDAEVEDVATLVEPGRDVFMLSEGFSIISRWDLVMKPWKAGRLRLSL